MDFTSLLKKLKLVKTFLLEIPNSKDFAFESLRLIVDSDNSHFTTGFNKSNKKYIGKVGNEFFRIKPKNNDAYPKMNVSANGEILRGIGTTTLKIEVNGFDKRWTISLLTMFPIFSIFVLWEDITLGSVIFLCIGFVFFCTIQIQVMKHNAKKFSEVLIKDIKLNLIK